MVYLCRGKKRRGGALRHGVESAIPRQAEVLGSIPLSATSSMGEMFLSSLLGRAFPPSAEARRAELLWVAK
jgi:hypothetical protein